MSISLLELLGESRRPRVLLVGDMILDRYQYGTTRRISPEAPIPVLDSTRRELRLGGCGNVAANLAHGFNWVVGFVLQQAFVHPSFGDENIIDLHPIALFVQLLELMSLLVCFEHSEVCSRPLP